MSCVTLFRSVRRVGSGALGTLLGAIALASTVTPTMAQRINVYTSEYFDDLNPLTERTYVSGWLGQLIASRLYRRSCITQSAQIEMTAECARPGLRVERDRIEIDARQQGEAYRCPIGPGDVSPRDFIRDSVRKTVGLLADKALQRNYYFGNGLRVIGNTEYPELQIQTPPNVGEKGLQYLDFPLFTGDTSQALTAIAPNVVQRLNDMTFGPWQLATSTNQKITLRPRWNPTALVPQNVPFDPTDLASEIQIESTEPSAMSRLAIRSDNPGGAQAESRAGLGHVFLNIDPAIANGVIGETNYNFAFSPAAAGPFYLGFNFDYQKSSSKAQLFDSEEFRRLLAQTLWRIPVLGDQFSGLSRIDPKMNGTWPGQSLLSYQDGAVTKLDADKLSTEIQNFLKRNASSYIAVNLRIWVTSEGRRMLDRTGVQQLKAALNRLWICDQRCGERAPGNEVGLFFSFLDDDNSQRKPSSSYDLVIDRMVHGDRLTRIADAVEPGNARNFANMTDRHVEPNRRALWRTETSAAITDMTRWLKERYYFIVLGEFRFRDLYYNKLFEAAAGIYCTNRGRLLHPTGAHLWKQPR